METYYPPSYQKSHFHCVYCGVYASQSWGMLFHGNRSPTQITVCSCDHCQKISYWHGSGQMLLPDESTAPPSHSDLPKDCQSEYNEARSIVSKSPRAAAALLRLCIQKLMLALGETKNNLNDCIASLVTKGLPIEVQKALDICRVVGNHSVHPGEIDLIDNPKIVASLFEMINFIVEDRISRPKQISALYLKLPEKDRDSIAKRDQQKPDVETNGK